MGVLNGCGERVCWRVLTSPSLMARCTANPTCSSLRYASALPMCYGDTEGGEREGGESEW